MADRGFNIRDMLRRRFILTYHPFPKNVRFPFAISRSINKDFLLHPFYLCEYTKKFKVYVLSSI